MKLIIAIIRPERLEDVQRELQQVLDEADRYRITVDAVEGHGAQQGELEWFRGQQVRPGLVSRTRIMIAVNDQYAQPAVNAILAGARSNGAGAIGDGKIFVVPLEDCIRIRTGERGGNAI
ncbi:MAG: P-II family nitrogen regulator [Kofleriaceae bacterium]|jgi:nitrogen regulatory protein P-II 2|nr:P-II family nitrogen regulator [Kofleriaceae bacterium]MBP9167256.1 P-II family nitrogen regulator [Kofleriaceae bacterium]MBP9860741.1 P-II family nitrogen regulator [Kofleriaceae bacterium]